MVTAAGLSKVYKPLTALQTPGFFNSWSKLDAARDAMKAEFEKEVSDAGFIQLGWIEVGSMHLMSNGFPVKAPDMNLEISSRRTTSGSHSPVAICGSSQPFTRFTSGRRTRRI